MTDHRHHDDDTIIIKPMSFAGTVLLSAGAGLAAGMLICWLFTGDCCADPAEHELAGLLETSSTRVAANLEPTDSVRS